MPWTNCPECDSIRGCVAGAWAILVADHDLPPSRELHDQDPAEYHRISRDLEAAYQRIGPGDHDLPERVAAEYLTPSVPTQGVLL